MIQISMEAQVYLSP